MRARTLALLLATLLAGSAGCQSSVENGHAGGSRPPASGAGGVNEATRGSGPQVVLLPDGAPGKGEVRFQVELARTEPERQRGLMFRRQLPLDRGMLFLFEREEVLSFWMKNTFIPLDMIFIDSQLRVVGVVENAEPRTLELRSPGVPAQYVLEINAGLARAHGITTGTRVRFVDVPLPPTPR